MMISAGGGSGLDGQTIEAKSDTLDMASNGADRPATIRMITVCG